MVFKLAGRKLVRFYQKWMKLKDCTYIVNWQSVGPTKIGHNLIFEKTNVVVSYGQESCGVQTHRYKNT